MSQPQRDYACVIHGDAYPWQYVENLYGMLCDNSANGVRLHVYTEADRAVPAPMIHHALTPWPGIAGPRRAWWYKMQMFNADYFQGPVLYLDLDVVITGSIDWVWELDQRNFWAVHDFRRLWKSEFRGINSSVMFWDTRQHDYIWKKFISQDLDLVIRRYRGDQDFLTAEIDQARCGFFDNDRIKSWKWQIKDGGMDMRTRAYLRPNSRPILDNHTSIVVFHGDPKPHEVPDAIIQKHWNIRVDP